MTTPYDPFGDHEYKVKYFQNSANNFVGKRPHKLDIDGNSITHEDEESKNGVSGGPSGVGLGMMARSDAYHQKKPQIPR